MIVFVAPDPRKHKEKEGFLQRVAAIDEIFKNEERVYVDGSQNAAKTAQLLAQADLIYVHSMYNANKIASSYQELGHKIITDLHGVVPEEEAYRDNFEAARVMAATEQQAFTYGKYFVAVSEMMVRHFDEKYSKKTNRRWIVLPVYSSGGTPAKQQISKKDTSTVIYAGGGQKWQNVDMMIDAVQKLHSTHKFIVLSHDHDAFASISTTENVILKSATSKEVLSYYKKASLGFILRNDTLVNRVACPTKLVEYLGNGVVPIVLSETIGDFALLGYKYITIKQFLEGTVTEDQINDYSQHNYAVYERFVQKAAEGKKLLLKAAVSIKKTASASVVNSDVLRTKLAFQETQNTVWRYEYQIEQYKKMIADYAKMAEYYRGELEELRSESRELRDAKRETIVDKIAKKFKA
ncbi:MAG TPA: hypothetical protein VD907_01165 [Verrucomicrobiae bacterium]|nr:hypothetical protein [Verrucomicrobiae bacterium]